MSPLFPLLALIARANAYGYELKRIVDLEFAPYWKIDFAQLYRSLAKLHAQGFVRVRAFASQAGPEKKQYSITARGHQALREWLEQPARSQDEAWFKTRLASMLEYKTDLPLLLAGSDDPLFSFAAQSSGTRAHVTGSLDGLMALASSHAEVIGTHLRDPDADEYNISFVQHLVAEQDVLLVHLAVREYGLLTARDNPKKIRALRDLTARDVRLVNRAYGSGARLWFQRHLHQARIDPAALSGWSNAATTYATVARTILSDKADVGPGLRATAEQFDLGFIPLGQEQFDLALPRKVYESKRASSFQTIFSSQEFRDRARSLPGYDLSRSGRVIAEIKYGVRRKI